MEKNQNTFLAVSPSPMKIFFFLQNKNMFVFFKIKIFFKKSDTVTYGII